MKNEKDQILFISSYPPRECGIATFTQDLVHAFKGIFDKTFDVKVCALQEDDIKRAYPEEVVMQLNSEYPEQCIKVANEINRNEEIVSVVIEHEFGLFKGTYGEQIFHLLDNVHKPVFICFHTVLADPDEKMLEVVSRIASKTEKIIVLTAHSKDLLESHYHIPSSQVVVIPHGVHLVKPVVNRAALKDKYGFSNKIILGTFGLISSNKGIETALEAIAALPDRKNILYLVMGKTHPCVYKNEGEKYREYLMQLTEDLGIEENVLFINKYLDLKELLTYLKLTDIYLFTSKDPKQTVSGTLSYAMASGCTVVSTAIPHAKEVLSDDAGYIFDFGNSGQLKEIITQLISNPQKLRETSVNAARKARSNAWENIANKFARLFKKYIRDEKELEYNLPSLKLAHFCKLTNANGMVQFSNMCDPDLGSGYTVDDNARALYVLTIYNELYPNDPFVQKYFCIYLDFLEKAILPNGSFLNYMDHQGVFTPQNHLENLDEANARSFVSLCRFVQSPAVSEGLKFQALKLLAQANKYIYTVKSPRSIAKVIKGLYFLDQYKKNPVNLLHIHHLSGELMRLYHEVSSPEWQWFEPYLTYNNSSIPEGLMYAYLATNESKYKKAALSTLDFLLEHVFINDRIRVISNNGWIKRGKPYQHKYGEQPMDVASVMEALYLFYQATGEQRFKDYMPVAFSWFLGNNHLGQLVYNPVNGGCHDGIEEFEVNINQGAESTLSYIVSRLTMDKLHMHEYVLSDLFKLSDQKPARNKVSNN